MTLRPLGRYECANALLPDDRSYDRVVWWLPGPQVWRSYCGKTYAEERWIPRGARLIEDRGPAPFDIRLTQVGADQIIEVDFPLADDELKYFPIPVGQAADWAEALVAFVFENTASDSDLRRQGLDLADQIICYQVQAENLAETAGTERDMRHLLSVVQGIGRDQVTQRDLAPHLGSRASDLRVVK